jgi:hypothetical protein
MWNSDGASVVSIPGVYVQVLFTAGPHSVLSVVATGTQIVRNCVWTANDAAVLLTSHKSFQIGFIH